MSRQSDAIANQFQQSRQVMDQSRVLLAATYLGSPTDSQQPVPVCPACGGAMEWKRTRSTVTAAGVTAVATFVCLTCEKIIHREAE